MPTNEEKRLAALGETLPKLSTQLRTAMATLCAAANALAPAEAREHDELLDRNAAIMAMSCHRMLRLVSNLSSLSEEALTVQLKTDDIVGFCRTQCKTLEALFSLKGISLRFRSEKESHLVAMDAALLERLLLNLMSNALKFTPEGGTVTLSLRFTPSQVRLSLRDTGCGIESDRLETLFSCGGGLREYDPPTHGAGLGLALCRRIAEAHGGSIVADSRVGDGTLFTVSLPDRRTERHECCSPRADYAGGFNRVLLELSDALGAEAFLQKYTD